MATHHLLSFTQDQANEKSLEISNPCCLGRLLLISRAAHPKARINCPLQLINFTPPYFVIRVEERPHYRL